MGLQVALRSEKAFGRLAFQGSEEVDWEFYHKRYVTRDASAREEWRMVKARGMMAGDVVFAYDILRRGVKHDDERLSKILPA